MISRKIIQKVLPYKLVHSVHNIPVQLIHSGMACTFRNSYYIPGQLVCTGIACTFQYSWYILAQCVHTGTGCR